MKRIFGAVFAIALITLMMELVLTRAFDVMIRPNMSYMVVTCALFAFGLAGIYMTLRRKRWLCGCGQLQRMENGSGCPFGGP